MRFANVDGAKLEAQPGLKGVCWNCDGEMVAKCGRVKVWHWAHKGRPPCDPWWESEMEWHRNWKDKFPKDWQEISQVDPRTGERHIADVKNPYGLVIEFQHSPIKPEEMQAREAFYGQMIWIVDGTRGPLDASFFNMGMHREPMQKDPLAFQVDWMGKSKLLHNWGKASAKVYLDFGDAYLWRLVLFDEKRTWAAVGPITRDILINDCLQGTSISVLRKNN